MENSAEIFEIALGLKEPWHIKEVNFDQSNGKLDIHLSFMRGHKFLSQDGEHYTAHDTVERTWQHLNFFQHKCYLHAKVPRVKQADGKIKTQEVPWAPPRQWFYALVRDVLNAFDRKRNAGQQSCGDSQSEPQQDMERFQLLDIKGLMGRMK